MKPLEPNDTVHKILEIIEMFEAEAEATAWERVFIDCYGEPCCGELPRPELIDILAYRYSGECFPGDSDIYRTRGLTAHKIGAVIRQLYGLPDPSMKVPPPDEWDGC
jgi:hypothetical protein